MRVRAFARETAEAGSVTGLPDGSGCVLAAAPSPVSAAAPDVLASPPAAAAPPEAAAAPFFVAAAVLPVVDAVPVSPDNFDRPKRDVAELPAVPAAPDVPDAPDPEDVVPDTGLSFVLPASVLPPEVVTACVDVPVPGW